MPSPNGFEKILDLVGSLGFPIVVALYLLFRMEATIRSLEQTQQRAMQELRELMIHRLSEIEAGLEGRRKR